MLPMYQTCTIAICDILGFKNLVRDNPLKDVVEKRLGWFRRALWWSIHKRDFPGEAPSLEMLRDQANLGVAWFSDTVLLYTLNDDDDALSNLLQSLFWLIFSTNAESNTRVRCGVAYGEVYIDQKDSIYVGQPLIDAIKLEQSQEWFGGALTERAHQRIPNRFRTGEIYDWPVVEYDVPVKPDPHPIKLGWGTFEPSCCQKQNIKKAHAIDWTRHTHLSLVLPYSGDHPEPTKDDWKKDKDICTKWRNTKAFHDAVCKHCNR